MFGRQRLSGIWGGFAIIFSLSIFLFSPKSLQAQTGGTVTGEIVDAQSLAPVSGAQVYLAALSQGTLSQASGRYLIVNVPVGTHEITVERLGLTTVTQQITVTAGGTTVADFQLETAALNLDEIVVTGTAGQARRREIGNSIAQINVADDILEPVSDVTSLLQGRAAGVSVFQSSGVVGDNTQIRIRGNVSAALSNDPLIYIDGIRVQSSAYDALAPVNMGQQYAVQATPSPLGDLNPNDIERIEIIKGAAATTLYGTEAASGVIQIFTKRGRTGAPEWTASLETGVNTPNIHGTTHTLRGTPTNSFPEWDGGACYPSCFTSKTGGNAHFLYLDRWMRDAALQQKYNMSVRGSAGAVSYFMSGSFEDDEDVFVTAGQSGFSLRSNLQVTLTSSLNFDFNAAWNSRDIVNIGCGDNLYGVCARSSYGGIMAKDAPGLDSLVYEPEHFTQIDRFITGGTVRYQPQANFTTRFTMGYDRAMNQGRTGVPYGFPRHKKGFNSLTDQLFELTTIDLVSTYGLDVTSFMNADLSVGLQRISEDRQTVDGWTEGFPGPGETTLSSGATSLAREDRSRVITGGAFSQAVIGFSDRLFVTAGVRVDGNSAFGQDFGWQVYPKVSTSYVISDESFFPENLGTLKLRSAWGTAGRAPGAFDAVRTWAPTPWGSQQSFAPNNLGNAALGPERTAEYEVGFESSTVNNRLTLDFTYYHQITSDALVSVGSPPSMGDWTNQLENIGKLKNTGMELGITMNAIQGRVWNVDVGGDISTNNSEILSLGRGTNSSSIRVGEPFPVVRGKHILNPYDIADPIYANGGDWYWFGPMVPTLMVTPRTTITMPKGIILSVRGEYAGGHWGRDGASEWAMIEGNPEYPACWDAYPLISSGQTEQLNAIERAWCTRTDFNRRTFQYPRDFFKLREVTVTLPLGGFVFERAERATLTVSGRNLYRWVKPEHRAYDPEAGGWRPGHSTNNTNWQRPSPPKAFTMQLRVTF